MINGVVLAVIGFPALPVDTDETTAIDTGEAPCLEVVDTLDEWADVDMDLDLGLFDPDLMDL